MIDIVERLKDAEVATHALFDYIFHDAREEIERLRTKIESMENQEPVGWFARIDGDGPLMECKHADISRVPLYAFPCAQAQPTPSHFLSRGALYLAPGAQPVPSVPDTHNDMVVGLDYQGAMSCARQRAKKEAGLLHPEGDARKDEKERELASEYYRQYTTPNP